MDNKLHIVNSFLEQINANQLEKVAELVSANFVFVSAVSGTINFDEYCKYAANNSECIETIVRDKIPFGDKIIVYLDITIIDNSLSHFSEMSATATFGFDNLLLKSVSMKYEATDQDMAYMKKFVSIQQNTAS